MFREFSPPPRQEMGLKHPENVFDGKFDQLAEAVRELDAGRLPAAETELPSGQVSMGERTEKAAKKEVELIFKQFKKGAQGFAELTAEKGSTFMALGAMVFPENPNLAFELATEMRLEGGVSKPVGIDTRVNVREEELVFQKMPVVSGENCLLAAGLRLMAERRYKNKGNQIVSTVAQLINWEGEGNDSEDSLSDNAIAWLNYRSLAQHLRGAVGGIDISLDPDKNWYLLSKETPNSKFYCPPGIDKDSFRFEGHQLITEGVSPEAFIKIARAARPAAEEETPDSFRWLQGESVAPPAEPEKPAETPKMPPKEIVSSKTNPNSTMFGYE